MTKEEILEYFKDINGAYNECTRYDSLKRMLDELEPTCEDAVSREQVLGIVSNPMNIRLDQIIRDLPSVKPVACIGKVEFDEEKMQEIVHEVAENMIVECEDCISREPFTDSTICEVFSCNECLFNRKDKGGCILEERVMALPSVQPKQKMGHWIRITNVAMKEKYMCSRCGRQIEDYGIEGLLPLKYPFCHCGAEMRGE